MGPGEHYFCLENREGKVLEGLMMAFAYYSTCHLFYGWIAEYFIPPSATALSPVCRL
jgi:hypothetical protein